MSMKAVYFIIIVVMIALALLCYNWSGIFIAEGALCEIGAGIGKSINRKDKGE